MLFDKEFFADPTKVSERKSSKGFAAPTKEQATTGRYMAAGDDYGVGRKQPVGREGNPKSDAAVLPKKSKRHELD